VRSLARAWRAKRGGEAVPLLTKLLIEGRDGHGADWPTFCALPELFPELAEIHLRFTIFLVSGGARVNAASFGPLQISYQRLTVLKIDSLVASYSSGHLTTPDAGRILRHIFAAVPNVRKLTIQHGSGWLSGNDRVAGNVLNAHPGVDGALSEMPNSLEHLHLDTFTLEPTDFDAAPDLSSLRLLMLTGCGPHATQMATRLVADNSGRRCPHLKLARCLIRVSSSVYSPLKSLDELLATSGSKPAPNVAATVEQHGADRPASAMAAGSSRLASSMAAGSSDME